ncbi:hypothetical protein D3C87_1935490 [compost metagenome]
MTVMASTILRPRIEPPEAARSSYSFTILARTSYFSSSSQCGDMVRLVQASGRADFSSLSDLPGLRSSMARTAPAATRPSS